MIRHAALFRLRHPAGSSAEADFLQALAGLASVPGVQDFTVAREVSPKNPYDFAVSMQFADEAAYRDYDAHPDHKAFVDGRWTSEVVEFMEHDTIAL